MKSEANSSKSLGTLLTLVNHILTNHPELLPHIENIILRASGFSYDFSENGEEDLIVKFRLLNPKVVFDVGANIGEWTKIALDNFVDSHIHGFELSELTFRNLIQNVKSTRVTLNNFGLSAREGPITYKDYGENSGLNTILLASIYYDSMRSPTLSSAHLRKGDTYCKEKNIEFIDFLKVDVEGAEYLVLTGFEEMLTRKSVRLIQFEYGYTSGDSKFLMRDFYEYFEKLGYIVGPVRKGSINFGKWTYKHNDFKSGPNYVAIRADDLELKAVLS